MKKKSRINAIAVQEQYKKDAKQLSFTELSKKYKLTYDSWRSVKQRAKKQGIPFDPKLHAFPEFLYQLGPRTAKQFTLDRLDCKGAYSPENCRWADKSTQTLNRSNAVKLTYKGETLPLKAWATRLNIESNVLYKRRQQGWTDAEIIEGIRTKQQGSTYSGMPWPKGFERDWQRGFVEYGQQGESPEAYYLRNSEELLAQRLRKLRECLDGCIDPPPKLLEDMRKLEGYIKDAREKLEKKRLRDRFMNRFIPGMSSGDKARSFALAMGEHVMPRCEPDDQEEPADDETDSDDGEGYEENDED